MTHKLLIFWIPAFAGMTYWVYKLVRNTKEPSNAHFFVTDILNFYSNHKAQFQNLDIHAYFRAKA
jgi:hypothetical protein